MPFPFLLLFLEDDLDVLELCFLLLCLDLFLDFLAEISEFS